MARIKWRRMRCRYEPVWRSGLIMTDRNRINAMSDARWYNHWQNRRRRGRVGTTRWRPSRVLPNVFRRQHDKCRDNNGQADHLQPEIAGYATSVGLHIHVSLH